MSATKGGHAAVLPAAKPDDIVTTLAPAAAPPAPPPSEIHVESVPEMIDELTLQEAFNAFRKMVREIGRDVAKRWEGMPAKFKPPHYVYYRCGLRGNPRTEVLRAEMTRQGWQDAPRGTYCTLYLSDRSQGVYVCTPMAIYRQYHEFENELVREANERALLQKKRQTVDALRDQGIEIESESQRHEQMTAEEFMGGRNVSARSGIGPRR